LLSGKRILVVSSKFPEEYSGSGLRAYHTYIRLEEKYKLSWDVIANSVAYQGNSVYRYEGKNIYRISSPIKIPKDKSLKQKLSILFSMLWETIFTLKFLIIYGSKYDLLHTFGNTWSIGIFSIYFSFKNKPIIRELVTDLKNPFYPIQISKYIKNIFMKKKSYIIAISKKLEILSLRYSVLNIWQRPNPIDNNKFFIDYDNKYNYRQEYSKFTSSDIVLCYIGSLRSSKNHIFLLDVLIILPNNFKLFIAGPENKSELGIFNNLLEKINTLGLSNRVQVEKNFIVDIDKYIKLSDIYLFPSKLEGLGTPILEAQACGIPVVSNLLKDITNTEIIEGEGGYCSILNPKEFALKIEMALNIPEDTLIKNAKYTINRASTKVIDEGYCKIMKELMYD